MDKETRRARRVEEIRAAREANPDHPVNVLRRAGEGKEPIVAVEAPGLAAERERRTLMHELRAWSARLRTTNPNPPTVSLNVASEMDRWADRLGVPCED